MILSCQTKFRTGRIAGVLLLLAAIAVLPLAGVVRADDDSAKKTFNERLRRLEQLVEKLARSNEKDTVLTKDGSITYVDDEHGRYQFVYDEHGKWQDFYSVNEHGMLFVNDEHGKWQDFYSVQFLDADGRKHEYDIRVTFRDAQKALSSWKKHLAEKQAEVNKLTAEIAKLQRKIEELSLRLPRGGAAPVDQEDFGQLPRGGAPPRGGGGGGDQEDFGQP